MEKERRERNNFVEERYFKHKEVSCTEKKSDTKQLVVPESHDSSSTTSSSDENPSDVSPGDILKYAVISVCSGNKKTFVVQ